MQRIRLVAGGDRHVGAEPQDVVLVDPEVIGVFLRPRVALEAGSGQWIEGKALGAFLALFGARAVERPVAFLPVEAGDMAAVERQPGDPVAVAIPAADAETGQRRLVALAQRRIPPAPPGVR